MLDLCRFGCTAIEDVHHIFAACPVFERFRKEATNDVEAATAKILQKENGVSNEMEKEIRETAKSLFSDCVQYWPLARTQYYLGFVPNLKVHFQGRVNMSYLKKERLRSSIHTTWHTAAIRLTGRIWGDVLRRVAPQRRTP